MAGKPEKQGETKTEKTLGRIGSERYARFVQKLLPLEKEFLTDIADQREERMAQRNMASNDKAIVNSTAMQQAGADAPQRGNALGLANTSTQLGAAAAKNDAQLESDLDKQYVGDLQAMTARGSGQAGAAISGLSSAAEAASARAAEEARLALANRQARQQAVGMGLGLGASMLPAGSIQGALGGGLGAATGALGLMSPTGTREAYNQPGATSGVQGFPYPGA